MENNISLPIILQLIGVIVIIAEIILPSGGILSVLAAGVFGYSLYIAFSNISTTAGMLFVAADIVIIPILVIVGLKLLAKSPVTLRKRLLKEEGVTSQSSKLEQFIGRKGKTVSNLRPSGIAVIDGKRVDVVSRGEYIEQESEVIVITVTGNQIIVRKKE